MDQSNVHLPMQKCYNGCEVKTLSDIELIAVILNTGTSGKNVINLAADIYNKCRGLHGIRKSGLRELAMLKGVGLAKAVRIQCALEMGRRITSGKNIGEIIDTPYKVWKYLLPHSSCLPQEEFMVINLNNRNQVLKFSAISRGTVTQTIIHPREIFREAIKESASSIIVAHNHPSGSLKPSEEDLRATKRLANAGEIVGIPLLDHLIVCEDSFLSMKEEGYL